MSRKREASRPLVDGFQADVPNRASFLGLPQELRAAILVYRLQTDTGRIAKAVYASQQLDLAILRTCKTLCAEGLAVFRILNKVVYNHLLSGHADRHGPSLRRLFQYYHAIEHFSNVDFNIKLGSWHVKQRSVAMCQLSGVLSDIHRHLVKAANAKEAPPTIQHRFKFDASFLLRSYSPLRLDLNQSHRNQRYLDSEGNHRDFYHALGFLKCQLRYTIADHKQKLLQNPNLRNVSVITNIDALTDEIDYLRIDENMVAFKDDSNSKMGRIKLWYQDSVSPEDVRVVEQEYDANKNIEDL